MTKAPKNLPSHDEQDKLCSYIFSEDDPRDGQRCGAFRLTTSHLCSLHSEDAKKVSEARSRQAKKQRELKESLEFGYHELQTQEGIAIFLEKMVNGTMAGYVKRDKAAVIAMLLPQMVKIARDRHGSAAAPKSVNAFQINIGGPVENSKVSANMTKEQLDAFIMGNEGTSVQILQEMQKEGKLVLEQKDDIIEIEAKDAPQPEALKIPKKELAELSKKTDIPLTAKQVGELFGDKLGDTVGAGTLPRAPEPAGFGELFESDNLPVELVPKKHEWRFEYREVKPGFGTQFYICKHCGFETKNTKSPEIASCDKPDYEADYKDKSVLGASDEDDIFGD